MNLRPGKSMLSILLAGILTLSALSGCSDKQESSSSASSAAQTTTAATEAETTANADAETTAPETTEATESTTTHISPTETVSSTLGAELDDLNVLLDRDADNTYKAKLENFVQDGDVIQSFTFIFYAPDGVSNMGTYKGGCGISVKADSATATGISPMTLNRMSTVLMQKSLGMFRQMLQQMLTQTAMCLLATGGAICNS